MQKLRKDLRLFFQQFNPFSANTTKWSNTLKQFVSNLATNCLSVFDHFVKLALKVLIKTLIIEKNEGNFSCNLDKKKDATA